MGSRIDKSNTINNFGEHYPRKGTETIEFVFDYITVYIETSESIIPVRGLKLHPIQLPR